MNTVCKISFLLVTLIAINAGAQTKPAPAKPSASVVAPDARPAPIPAVPVPPTKEQVLRNLWNYFADLHAEDTIASFMRKNKDRPGIDNLDDPKIIKRVKDHYFERYSKFYSEAASEQELRYLDQLYSSSLMKRVNAVDQKIWSDTPVYLESLYKEVAGNKPSSSPAPAKPKR